MASGEWRAGCGRQAVVFKAVQVTDECTTERFLSLMELTASLNMDVWLFHEACAAIVGAVVGVDEAVVDVAEAVMDVAEAVMDVAEAVMDVAEAVVGVAETVMDVAEAVVGVAARSAKVFVQPIPALDSTIYSPDGHHVEKSKAFSSKVPEQAPNTDLVAKPRTHINRPSWPLVVTCRSFHKPLSARVVHNLLALFGMSRRLVVHWLKLRATGDIDVSGHSEALAAPICNSTVWGAK